MSAPPASPEAERVRHLVRADARQLVERFEDRFEMMVHYFSRLRDRDALLAPVHSLLPTLRFSDLVVLEPAEQSAVLAFSKVVEELRWYLRYTDHMPGALGEALKGYRKALVEAHATLDAALSEPVLERAPHDASVTKPPARKGTPKKTAAKKTAAKKTAAKKTAAKKTAAKKTAAKKKTAKVTRKKTR